MSEEVGFTFCPDRINSPLVRECIPLNKFNEGGFSLIQLVDANTESFSQISVFRQETSDTCDHSHTFPP